MASRLSVKKRAAFPPKWFNLSKYIQTKAFGPAEWYDLVSIRRLCYWHLDLSPEPDGKWTTLLGALRKAPLDLEGEAAVAVQVMRLSGGMAPKNLASAAGISLPTVRDFYRIERGVPEGIRSWIMEERRLPTTAALLFRRQPEWLDQASNHMPR